MGANHGLMGDRVSFTKALFVFSWSSKHPLWKIIQTKYRWNLRGNKKKRQQANYEVPTPKNFNYYKTNAPKVLDNSGCRRPSLLHRDSAISNGKYYDINWMNWNRHGNSIIPLGSWKIVELGYRWLERNSGEEKVLKQFKFMVTKEDVENYCRFGAKNYQRL